MRKGYTVQVLHLGEPILTIESTMLCGKAELSDEDKAAIDDAGEHLIAFAGLRLPVSTFSCEPLGSEAERIWDENVEKLYSQ